MRRGLVAMGMGEADAAHGERAEGITHHGVGGFGGKAAALRAAADPVAGVALAGFPIDVVETAPDHRLFCSDVDADQLDDIAPGKVCHLPVAQFDPFRGEEIGILGPLHPAVQFFPGFGNRRGGQGAIAPLFRPNQQPRGADRHGQIDWSFSRHSNSDVVLIGFNLQSARVTTRSRSRCDWGSS